MLALRTSVLLVLCAGASAQLMFSAGFSDNTVLQRSETRGAAVYGFANSSIPITVSVTGTTTAGAVVSYTLQADAHAWEGGGDIHPNTPAPKPHGDVVWKATLKPASAGGSYVITVSQAGANATAIEQVTFGDVWFCSGTQRELFTAVPN
jgi:hypothetical protein